MAASVTSPPCAHRPWILTSRLILFALFLSLTSFRPILATNSASLNPCEFEGNFIYCTCTGHALKAKEPERRYDSSAQYDPDNPMDDPSMYSENPMDDPMDSEEPLDSKDTEEINCSVFGPSSPNEAEWFAIANLTRVKALEIIMRPARTLNYSLPQMIFSNMNQLIFFKVKMGKIDVLPSWAFSNSSSLSDVILEDNMISELSPNSFAFMKNLTTVNLAQNRITQIPRDVFVRLSHVKALLLSYNNIQVIHDRAFKDLESLEEMEVQNNNLTVIARDVFFGLKSLKRLDLRYNLIELLGDHVFAELPSLEDLDLLGNRITYISATAFFGLKEMHRLNLKDNNVAQFFPETFHNFPKIHFLDLRNNQLETFAQELVQPIYTNFMNLTSMQFMLEGNPLKCDCGIQWLQELWRDTGSTNLRAHLNKTECRLPRKVYILTKEEAMRKNIPQILVDEDDETSTMSSENSPRMMTVMSVAFEEFDCPEKATTRAPKKAGRKSKNRHAEIEVQEEDASAILQNPEGRTESSSQSHQSNNINVPGSGSRLECLIHNWAILLYLLLMIH